MDADGTVVRCMGRVDQFQGWQLVLPFPEKMRRNNRGSCTLGQNHVRTLRQGIPGLKHRESGNGWQQTLPAVPDFSFRMLPNYRCPPPWPPPPPWKPPPPPPWKPPPPLNPAPPWKPPLTDPRAIEGP